MSEWQEYKLTELGTLARGKSKHRPRWAAHLYGGKYPFIQTGKITAAGKYINDYETTYSEAGLAQSKLWPKNTLCITIAANIAEIAILNIEACFPDSVLGFIPDKSKCNLDFIFYTLKHFRTRIRNLAIGSVQDNINLGTFNLIEFKVPPLDEQRRIATVLSTLDAKIDLLRRQNQTLEQIAQTLFKRWFVEFEYPVNSEKRIVNSGESEKRIVNSEEPDNFSLFTNHSSLTYKSSGGPMVASELGEIPEGWRVGTLGEILHLNYGKGLRTDDRKDGDYLVVGSSGIVGNHNEYLVEAPGIVIGRKGTIGKVIWLDDNFFPIDTTFYVTDALGVDDLYFHYFVLSKQRFDRIGSDSAVPGLNRNLALSLEEIIPELDLIKKFSDIVRPIFKKRHLNETQIQTLTRLRDTLLPKLMSGQLRVNSE